MKSLLNISILLFSFLFALSLLGCSVLSALMAEQQWSENYALMDGVEANDPAFIDGDLNSMGKSQFPETSPESLQFPLSEALITLPERKSIHKIVIHSPNLQKFDVMIMDESGGWKRIKEVKSNNKEVINLRISTITDGIRIRVKGTSGDAAQRRQHTRRVGNVILVEGNIRASAGIKEIELYGYADKNDILSAEPQKEESFDDLFK